MILARLTGGGSPLWVLKPETSACLYTWFGIFFSVCYGLSLASLPFELFKDWLNYLAYAEISSGRLRMLWDRGGLAFFANEPVWLLLNALLYQLLSADSVARLFVFIPAAVVAWIVLNKSRGHLILGLLILLLPLVMKNHLTHIRQGVAVAFFLVGYFSEKKYMYWSFILITPFIHASFFFIILVLFVSGLLSREKMFIDVRIIFFTILGVAVSLSLSWVSGMLGARQANEYEFTAAQVSGLGFVFWLIIIFLMLGEGQAYLRKYAFEISMIIFYLSTYFLVEVTGRIFESSLLLVLFAGFSMTGLRRLCFIGAVFLLGVQQWFVRSSEPLMGFGIS